MIDRLTKQQLKSLQQDERWQAIEVFVVAFLDKAKEMPVKGEDEFNTLWNLAHREGVLDGVKLFFREIEENSND